MGRAERRHRAERAKAEARRKLARAMGPEAAEDGARLGRWTSTHSRPCSCEGCKRLGGKWAPGPEVMKHSDRRRAAA